MRSYFSINRLSVIAGLLAAVLSAVYSLIQIRHECPATPLLQCLAKGLSSYTEQKTDPPPAPSAGQSKQEPVHASSEPTSDEIITLINLITDNWNRGILQPSLFASRLDYYGKNVSRDSAIAETYKYFQRWYSREFVVDRNSITTATTGNGEVYLTYNYTFSGQRNGAITAGTGRYFIRVRRNGDHLEIISFRDDYTPIK